MRIHLRSACWWEADTGVLARLLHPISSQLPPQTHHPTTNKSLALQVLKMMDDLSFFFFLSQIHSSIFLHKTEF